MESRSAGNTIKGMQASFQTFSRLLLIRSHLVVARFRPPNKAELASGGDSIVDFESEETCSINVCELVSLQEYVLLWHFSWALV